MHVGGDCQLKWPERARSAEVQIDLTNPGANHRANDTRALTTGKVTWEATLFVPTKAATKRARGQTDEKVCIYLHSGEKMVVSCRTTTRPNDGTNLWSKPSARPARIALLLILERGGQLSGCQTIKLGSGLTYRTSRNSGFRPCQSLALVALRDGCSARVAGTKDPSEPSRTN